MRIKNKHILDVTCGGRSIWFNKNHPHALYCDKRNETVDIEWKKEKHIIRPLEIRPDIVCDFTDLPFDDNSFYLIVFDPPHAKNLSEKSWMKRKYGDLPDNWKPIIKGGFDDCMRVLRLGGTLVFKWSDVQIRTADVIKAIGEEPLFGHRSGKRSNTHWMTFMKPPEAA